MKRVDIIGHKFNRITVVSFAYTQKGKGRCYHLFYNCICECGNTCIIEGSKLRNGHTQSCGCYRHKRQVEANTKHNGRYSRLYVVWCDMKGRCYNKNDKRYNCYGARGITVCDEWKNDFNAFQKWAEKTGYNPKAKRGECTIDRINNDLGYSPENCRWITNQKQANNKSNNVFLTYKGETKTIAEWSRITGIKQSTIQARIKYQNWSVEKALSQQVRKKIKKSVDKIIMV